MSALDIHMFPALSDNYGYIIHDPAAGVTATIDTPDADVIAAELARSGRKLTHILNTHHHHDHTGGNERLKEEFGARVIGPEADKARIPGIDETVAEGRPFRFGSHDVIVLDTPGHTHGHIAFIFPEAKAAFVGDTLFALGCGRLFEGTPEEMWASLAKLAALPDETRVYCGHEYTLSNAKFAVTIEPENPALTARASDIESVRAAGRPTIPTTIGLEKATNPFLRAAEPGIRKRLGMEAASDAAVFGEIRRRKDTF